MNCADALAADWVLIRSKIFLQHHHCAPRGLGNHRVLPVHRCRPHRAHVYTHSVGMPAGLDEAAIGERTLLSLAVLLAVLSVQMISIGLRAERIVNRTHHGPDVSLCVIESTVAEPAAS